MFNIMFISNAISSCAISSVQNPSKSSSSVLLLNRSINVEEKVVIHRGGCNNKVYYHLSHNVVT